MNTKFIPTSSMYTDMLSIFDTIHIKNDEKISQPDREFCKKQQELLYESLNQIYKWYEIFYKEAENYRESHKISFIPNGSIKIREPFDPDNSPLLNYKKHEFTPFESINEMVEKNLSAIRSFSSSILSYFNHTYNISVPYPDIDEENIQMGFRPVYTTYIDLVINHLGGKGFRETAEEEIIKRFHEATHINRAKSDKPELKGNKITFPDVIRFDEFYFQYNKISISYSYRTELEDFCTGIALAGAGQLNGSSCIIHGLDTSNIKITDWYTLSTGSAEAIKFFKNGRIDVRFSCKTSAEECFQKLRLV